MSDTATSRAETSEPVSAQKVRDVLDQYMRAGRQADIIAAALAGFPSAQGGQPQLDPAQLFTAEVIEHLRSVKASDMFYAGCALVYAFRQSISLPLSLTQLKDSGSELLDKAFEHILSMPVV